MIQRTLFSGIASLVLSTSLLFVGGCELESYDDEDLRGEPLDSCDAGPGNCDPDDTDDDGGDDDNNVPPPPAGDGGGPPPPPPGGTGGGGPPPPPPGGKA